MLSSEHEHVGWSPVQRHLKSMRALAASHHPSATPVSSSVLQIAVAIDQADSPGRRWEEAQKLLAGLKTVALRAIDENGANRPTPPVMQPLFSPEGNRVLNPGVAKASAPSGTPPTLVMAAARHLAVSAEARSRENRPGSTNTPAPGSKEAAAWFGDEENCAPQSSRPAETPGVQRIAMPRDVHSLPACAPDVLSPIDAACNGGGRWFGVTPRPARTTAHLGERGAGYDETEHDRVTPAWSDVSEQDGAHETAETERLEARRRAAATLRRQLEAKAFARGAAAARRRQTEARAASVRGESPATASAAARTLTPPPEEGFDEGHTGDEDDDDGEATVVLGTPSEAAAATPDLAPATMATDGEELVATPQGASTATHEPSHTMPLNFLSGCRFDAVEAEARAARVLEEVEAAEAAAAAAEQAAAHSEEETATALARATEAEAAAAWAKARSAVVAMAPTPAQAAVAAMADDGDEAEAEAPPSQAAQAVARARAALARAAAARAAASPPPSWRDAEDEVQVEVTEEAAAAAEAAAEDAAAAKATAAGSSREAAVASEQHDARASPHVTAEALSSLYHKFDALRREQARQLEETRDALAATERLSSRRAAQLQHVAAQLRQKTLEVQALRAQLSAAP